MRLLNWLTRGAALLALALLPACRGGESDSGVPAEVEELQGEKGSADLSRADVKGLVRGNTAFALDLYRQLAAKERANLVFSPYSISAALAMTYAGAKGRTADEMQKVLHFELGQEGTHPSFAALSQALKGDGKAAQFELSVANALWGQKGYPYRKEFLQLTEDYYSAGLKLVDFSRDPGGARRAINAWVAQETRDRVRELLKSGGLDPNTRLVLTNATYFKAAWKTPFEERKTKPADFQLADGKTVSVPMMHVWNDEFDYCSGNGFQVVKLPYKGNRLAMLVFLPDKGTGIQEFERGLTTATLDAALSQFKIHKGDVALPRFKVSERFRLDDELKTLGMPTAFSEEADFSGMASVEELKISRVTHAAYMDVNERGTEAAAATIAGASAIGAFIAPPFVFRADHPFLFLIRDNQTGTVLFIGRVMQPQD